MTTQRKRSGRLITDAKQEPSSAKFPARLFPVQSEIQHLENDLDAFNERIVELENEGHRGHAMEVLKANAIDLARKIDELAVCWLNPLRRVNGLYEVSMAGVTSVENGHSRAARRITSSPAMSLPRMSDTMPIRAR